MSIGQSSLVTLVFNVLVTASPKVVITYCQGVEGASCSCYQVIREEMDRLLR